MDGLLLILSQVAIMAGVALVFGGIALKLRQPAVIGEILGGIIVGPSIFGMLSPELFSRVFPYKQCISDEFGYFIQAGMLLFMFMAGLEINFRSLWRKRKAVIFTAIPSMVIPIIQGILMVIVLKDIVYTSPKIGFAPFSLLIGIMYSISALPVIVRILIDIKMIKTDLGTIILGAATLNDLIGWTLFAALMGIVVTNDASATTILISILRVGVFSFLVMYLGQKLSFKILRCTKRFLSWPTGNILMIVFLIFGLSFIAEKLGIHPFFAVFILGIAVRRTFRLKGTVIAKTFQNMALGLFAPLYFVSIGLKANFILDFNLVLVISVLLIACTGKIFGAGLGAYLAGLNLKNSLSIGFGLNARGAIEIVIASLAMDAQIIDHRLFVAFVIMSIVTSVISGSMLKFLNVRKEDNKECIESDVQNELKNVG